MDQKGPPIGGLRLRGEDAEDLAIISACLQDSLVSVRDLAYDRDARTFVFVANRFCWESCREEDGEPERFERTLCGIALSEVDAVAYRGFRRNEEDRILSLLAIRPATGKTGGIVDLEFAAGATIRLRVSALRCHALDLGERWQTGRQPDHPLDEPA